MINIVVVDYKFIHHSNFAENLRKNGFDVASVSDFMELVLHLFNSKIDVVIFDIESSGSEEIQAIKKIRSFKNLQALGIIILACRCDIADRSELISNGADAFLSKPVEMKELCAYINNICRHTKSRESTASPAQWNFYRSEWRLVTPSGKSVALSHLEVSLIEMLVKSIGKPVKRRDIISAGFGLDPLSYDNRRLDSIVSRLRRKIHNVYPFSQPIKVVHSVGYAFAEPISNR